MRFIDIILSCFIIVVLMPILLLVCICNLLTGEHKIFYQQIRIGKGGKKFKILKFATMLQNSSTMPGGFFVENNDNRLLPFGKFLRRTKINEIPQLLNVLYGDMSLVGFRPLISSNFETINKLAGIKAYEVLPGITSLASIVLRNEEEILINVKDKQLYYDNVILPHKAICDVWLAENRNAYNYVIILMLTVIALFFPKSKLPLGLLYNAPVLKSLR